MTDEELLDKVDSLLERSAKPYLTIAGGYMLSAVVIAWNINDWIVDNIRGNLGALAAFGIGGVLTGAVLASAFWRHLAKRLLRAKAAVAGENRRGRGRELAEKIRALPSAQRAVLWAAYNRDGAFRADGDFSAGRGRGDLMALKGMGIIERVGGGTRPVWNLALEARREIDGSDELRGALEADYAQWSAKMDGREYDRLVEDARRDVAGLDDWGRKMLTDLLGIDGPVPISDRTADDLINHIGKRLVAIETDSRGQLTARATDVAREVVPARGAEEDADGLFDEPTG